MLGWGMGGKTLFFLEKLKRAPIWRVRKDLGVPVKGGGQRGGSLASQPQLRIEVTVRKHGMWGEGIWDHWIHPDTGWGWASGPCGPWPGLAATVTPVNLTARQEGDSGSSSSSSSRASGPPAGTPQLHLRK